MSDFFRASKQEGREQLGIDNLDDPATMREVFTRMTPERRLMALSALRSHKPEAVPRGQTREYARLCQLESELEQRHRDLLLFGR
jgi:hypothetical protein